MKRSLLFVFVVACLFFAVLMVCAASCEAAETGVVEYTTDNCVWCERMAPTIAELARSGWPIRSEKLGRSNLDPIANVQSFPTFVAYVNGREITRAVGAQSREMLYYLCTRCRYEQLLQEVKLLRSENAKLRALTAEPVDLKDEVDRYMLQDTMPIPATAASVNQIITELEASK